MIRNYSDRPVAPEAIEPIVDLARHAPSAGFTQGQSFVVVTRPDLRRSIAGLCGEEEYVSGGFHPFLSAAPVLLVPCASEAAYHRRYRESDKLQADGTKIRWPVPFWFMDVGCSVMIALLATVDGGLAAAFVGVHYLDALRVLLNIPAEVTPMGVIAVSYRAPDTLSPSIKRGRKPEGEYVHREGW
jgi:nitroreductase